MCMIEEDSSENMLIKCSKSQQLWKEVESWLSEIGLRDYTIDEQKIILGECQKSYWINIVILITKRVLFNAKLDGKIPRFYSVRYNTKVVYNYELLKLRLIQKENLFEKRCGLMIDYMEE